jgi:menaquinone-9 beta-reductase
MTDRYDAIVVGARVAGSMTALHLSRLGHRVLIVDRAGPPADTLSTHALLRTAVLQLKRAGVLAPVVDAGTPPVRTITLGFGAAPSGST